jgi:hypothetical protein
LETQRFNITEPGILVERFTTSDTVTITLLDLSDGSTETLDSNSCAEIGSTGLFSFELAQITTYPTSFTEYAYVMNNGAVNKDGKVILYDEADKANGANQTTITVEDSGSSPIADVSVQVLNSAQTLLLDIKDTDSNGQVVFALDDGSYKIRLAKSQYSFTVPEDLTVSGTTVDTYDGTALVITPGSGAGECEVSIFTSSQRPTVSLASLSGTAQIINLPVELTGIYYPGQKIAGTYEPSNNRIFWILPRGSTCQFKVDDLGINSTAAQKAIPDAASADYKDL